MKAKFVPSILDFAKLRLANDLRRSDVSVLARIIANCPKGIAFCEIRAVNAVAETRQGGSCDPLQFRQKD